MFHSISKLHLTGKITDEEKAELKGKYFFYQNFPFFFYNSYRLANYLKRLVQLIR
jgi:hypothetical protein